MFHQGQRGVSCIQHGPTGDGRGTREVGDQADILLQQCSGQAGKPVQAAGVTTKSVEREAVPAAAGDDLGETVW
jgi:hypothetical protein